MPRIVSAAYRKMLNQRLGTIPILVLTVYWAPPAPTTFSNYPRSQFTSKDKILSVSSVNVARRDDHTGTTGSCSVTLDDSDGYVKDFTNNFQLEGTNCRLEQLFEGLADSATLMLGKITDIVWNEGNRTVSFTIESETFSEELGFQPNLDDDPALNPDSIDVAWPLVFGRPIHVPAVHARHKAEGYLESAIQLTSDVYTKNVNGAPSTVTFAQRIAQILAGTAVGEFTVTNVRLSNSCDVKSHEFLEDESVTTGTPTLNKIYVRNGELFPQDSIIKIEIEGIIFEGYFEDNVFTVLRANCEKYVNVTCADRDVADKDVNNFTVCWISDPKVSLVKCNVYLHYTAGQPIFGICIKQEGNKCWFEMPFVSDSGAPFLLDGSNVFDSVYTIEPCGLKHPITDWFQRQVRQDNLLAATIATTDRAFLTKHLLVALDELIKNDRFWSASEEAVVHLVDDSQKEVYVCNLIPSTKIRSVYAYRRDDNNRRVFVPVPSKYYTKFYDYPIDGFNTTALVMDHLLTDIEGQGWENDLYVTMESSVGPNIVDVIRWILTEYTDVIIDSSSFDHVRNKLQHFPVNFAILEKQDALRVAQSIAWESRCALSIINNTAILYYVAETPSPVLALNESNIEEKTLSIAYSQLADITTRFELEWKDSYKPRNQRAFLDSKRHHHLDNIHKFTFSQNTFLYGVLEESRKFLTYNVRDYVAISAGFWLNRKSNSWTKIKLNTFLNGILLLPWDAVRLQLPNQDFFIKYDVLAIVESAAYNFADKTTTLDLLLPIRQSYSVADTSFWITQEQIVTTPDPALKYKEATYDRQLGLFQ